MDWKKYFSFNKYKAALLIIWLLFLSYEATHCTRLGGPTPTIYECILMSLTSYLFYIVLVAGLVVLYLLVSVAELLFDYFRKK